ncbi:hypothetical protein [Actinotalea sp.]|uniref:hypothetical protein n=1 Tax=Actinotalea sp. TaxID=1872145 RepID=UPI00356376EC
MSIETSTAREVGTSQRGGAEDGVPTAPTARAAAEHLAAGGEPDPAWLTATVRPVGSFGRGDVGRLRALLQALSACASIVVLDLQAVRLRSPRAAEAIEEAAAVLEAHGGCLVCLHADDSAAAFLGTGRHAVLVG